MWSGCAVRSGFILPVRGRSAVVDASGLAHGTPLLLSLTRRPQSRRLLLGSARPHGRIGVSLGGCHTAPSTVPTFLSNDRGTACCDTVVRLICSPRVNTWVISLSGRASAAAGNVCVRGLRAASELPGLPLSARRTLWKTLSDSLNDGPRRAEGANADSRLREAHAEKLPSSRSPA